MLVEKSSLQIRLSTSAAHRLIITFLGMIFSTNILSRMLYFYIIITLVNVYVDLLVLGILPVLNKQDVVDIGVNTI